MDVSFGGPSFSSLLSARAVVVIAQVLFLPATAVRPDRSFLLQVPEVGDSQGVLPGVGQPWVEVTFLERRRERLYSWHRTNEALYHQFWDPIAVCSWAS